MKNEILYDESCYNLAVEFLDGHDLNDKKKAKYADELAGEIQQIIEDFLIEKGLVAR